MRHARGFTMLEMLFAMTVVAVLLGIAAPSVQELIARQRLSGATSELISSLIMTRGNAVRLERNVTLRSAAGTTDWSPGWNIAHPDAAQPAIFQRGALKNAIITGPASVTYQFNGRVSGNAGLRWRVTAKGTDLIRCVELELNGLPSQKTSDCT